MDGGQPIPLRSNTTKNFTGRNRRARHDAAAHRTGRGTTLTRPPTPPHTHARTHRGEQSDGTFRRHTGAGYVAPKDGAYKRAEANGVEATPLLVETFCGFGPALLALLRDAAEFKSNRLSAAEYDETTWSARTWLTFVVQHVSVAVHKAVAREASDALGLTAAVDPRGVPRG